ncbi:hypothetical protein P7K49_004572 [Saguinus oedipus]|uniref:Uncharacterized protein n=1 Tax=Saguinus oedipus TaxID=9490 RepID=A0ABQ9W864_SAGOE|nr:hypothetical protein P7K49_004572 [Saguinus oedipus]
MDINELQEVCSSASGGQCDICANESQVRWVLSELVGSGTGKDVVVYLSQGHPPELSDLVGHLRQKPRNDPRFFLHSASHIRMVTIPLCKVIRFNIDYTIHFIEEMMPEGTDFGYWPLSERKLE